MSDIHDYSEKQLLKFAIDSGIIDLDSVLKDIDDMNNKKILEKHPNAITRYADGRWKTYIVNPSSGKRKQIAKSTKEELEAEIIKCYKLFQKQYDLTKMTFAELFINWMTWRRLIGAGPKTLIENKNEWTNYIADSNLASMRVSKIDTPALEEYFLILTKDHAITRKRFGNIKSVINGMLKRACVLGIISHNPLADMDTSLFRTRFKPVETKKENYSAEERKAILDYLADKNDVYSLAIQLAFYLCVRIGELAALKKEDYENGMLHIRRAVRRYQGMDDELNVTPLEYSVEERIKGNQEEGFRSIPLTPNAEAVLRKAIALNPKGEYLFMRNGEPILGDTFNEQLKKVCTTLGIKYRSSHQIRFTTATMFFEAGVPINQLSTLLGHSDTQTTFHYIRQRKADDKTKAIMLSVLD